MKVSLRNILLIITIACIVGIFIVPASREKIISVFAPKATVELTSHLSEKDYDIELKGINTASTNLKNFYGKPVFLNFWGTWCPPCREEWPTIQKLYEQKKDNAGFVLIAMQDEESKVRTFLKENNYTVPVYIAESPISDKILPKAFPTTFLLNKNGEIIIRKDASYDWNTTEIYNLINKASE